MTPNYSAAGYSGTPLPKKLGIGLDSAVLALGNWLDFELPSLMIPVDTDAVPDRAVLDPAVQDPAVRPGGYDIVLLFCPDFRTLSDLFDTACAAHPTSGALWVCWLKRSSKISTDLTATGVREFGLAHGRVDVKVAALDAIWSGLKFVTRLADR